MAGRTLRSAPGSSPCRLLKKKVFGTVRIDTNAEYFQLSGHSPRSPMLLPHSLRIENALRLYSTTPGLRSQCVQLYSSTVRLHRLELANSWAASFWPSTCCCLFQVILLLRRCQSYGRPALYSFFVVLIWSGAPQIERIRYNLECRFRETLRSERHLKLSNEGPTMGSVWTPSWALV